MRISPIWKSLSGTIRESYERETCIVLCRLVYRSDLIACSVVCMDPLLRHRKFRTWWCTTKKTTRGTRGFTVFAWTYWRRWQGKSASHTDWSWYRTGSTARKTRKPGSGTASSENSCDMYDLVCLISLISLGSHTFLSHARDFHLGNYRYTTNLTQLTFSRLSLFLPNIRSLFSFF